MTCHARQEADGERRIRHARHTILTEVRDGHHKVARAYVCYTGRNEPASARPGHASASSRQRPLGATSRGLTGTSTRWTRSAFYLLRDPVLGYSATDHIEQFRYIANRRARQLHMDEPFPGAQCTLPA